MKINGKSVLYHATAEYHKEIKLELCNEFTDFGRGYYLTSSYPQAVTWAMRKRKPNAWIFTYSVTDGLLNTKLKLLPLLEFNMDWLDVILYYRLKESKPIKAGWEDIDTYDVVFDRMADGQNISELIGRYNLKKISKEKLLEEVRGGKNWKKHRDQYCFRTDKAIGLLRRTKELCYKNGEWEERELVE